MLFRSAIGRFGTGQTDQLCFLLPVEFAVVFPVWRLTLNAAGKAALAEALPDSRDRAGGHFQRFGRAVVRPGWPVWAFIHLQQNANAGLLGCWALPASEAFEEVGPLLSG